VNKQSPIRRHWIQKSSWQNVHFPAHSDLMYELC
jgi:hypothetical protein